MTAHRNLPPATTLDFSALCVALKERYGKTDAATKSVLRADLATI
jgi:hypothetical protein